MLVKQFSCSLLCVWQVSALTPNRLLNRAILFCKAGRCLPTQVGGQLLVKKTFLRTEDKFCTRGRGNYEVNALCMYSEAQYRHIAQMSGETDFSRQVHNCNLINMNPQTHICGNYIVWSAVRPGNKPAGIKVIEFIARFLRT